MPPRRGGLAPQAVGDDMPVQADLHHVAANGCFGQHRFAPESDRIACG
jgi:hypothetical protein